jgi:hypothetical protein
MPKWEKFLDEAEEVPTFEKFDKSLKNGRRIIKRDGEETVEEKEQRKREIDEKRAVKRRDEV